MAIDKVKHPAEFMINISMNADNDLQGFLEFIPSGETARFNSLMEMMMLMQKKITQYGFPQPTTTMRSWKDEPDQEKWGY